MSYERKRRRFIRDLQTARFRGGAPVLIDEHDLPLLVQERLRGLRAEIGQLNQALAQRNLDLLELRRELRILHRHAGAATRRRTPPVVTPQVLAADAALHAGGRCTCGGGGSCEWCLSHCLHCGAGIDDRLNAAVLEACAGLPEDDLREAAEEGNEYGAGLRVAIAELSRRGLK